MSDFSLIIFVKNPIAGQVKTRVAASVGHAKAVEVYQYLLAYTQRITQSLHPNVRLNVYYGDFINETDPWEGGFYQKFLQKGNDLGQRMKNAFEEQFALGATKVVIVGSDCLEISALHIQDAFEALNGSSVVIGPAQDGGYYLIGMDERLDFVFENKPWSEPDLFRQTVAELETKKISYQCLEILSDIDTWEDFKQAMVRADQKIS